MAIPATANAFLKFAFIDVSPEGFVHREASPNPALPSSRTRGVPHSQLRRKFPVPNSPSSPMTIR